MAIEADLVLEDGSGIPTANTYALVATADAYHSLYSNSAWTTGPTNDEKATALIAGTQYLDLRWEFAGELANPTTASAPGQALKWPRDDGGLSLYDAQRNEIPADSIPRQVVEATLEYALVFIVSGRLLPDPTVPDDAGRFVTLSREKLGPLESETRYSDTRAVTVTRKYALADRIMKQSGLVLRSSAKAIRA